MRWIAGTAFALILVLAVCSFLPLIGTDAWSVRFWDHPRVQVAFLLTVLLAIHLIASERDAPRILSAVLVLAALAAHGLALLPFTTVAPPVARLAGSCAPGDDLRILSFNVQRGNEDTEAFLRLVAAEDPDVILLMETDEAWDAALRPLADAYPAVVKHLPDDPRSYGMHLLSRRPLVSSQVVLAYPEAPAIVASLRLASGAAVRIQGLHPRAPALFEHGTTRRDATLYRAALDAASSGRPSILVGDFNAVPWEGATERMMRLGGLLEPRIGRGLFMTYGADSVWKGWPLDYVVYQDSFGLLEYRLLPGAGSDHRAVLAHLCLAPGLAEAQSVPPAGPDDIRVVEAALAKAQRQR